MLRRFARCAAVVLSLVAGQLQAEAPREPIQAVEAFFTALSDASGKPLKLEGVVTDDFIVFEMGEVFDLEAFYALVGSAGTVFTAMRWSLSDFTVSGNGEFAHVSYRNDGRFVYTDGNELVSHWLESALLVRDGSLWKLKFLQSDLVTRELQRVDGVVEPVYPVSAN
jgi:hypothetical protein